LSKHIHRGHAHLSVVAWQFEEFLIYFPSGSSLWED
jgi:hypothetical protein